MIKEAIGKGTTIDEAKENAIALLGANIDDDIQFEVIATPKKKTLGLFGGCKAEVRVFIELPDEKPKKKPQKSSPKKAENSASTEKKAEAKASQKASKDVKSSKAEKATQRPSFEDEIQNAVDSSEIAPDSRASKAVAYLNTILTALGCTDITIKVAEKDNCAFILLDGEGLGVVIGHRGETLDSLQYLAGLVANNGGGYYKVSLNIGNYREKREQALTQLANRVSAQAIRTGKSRTLESMNPYERRVIHTAIQDIEGVVSHSVGEGNSRRVVISPLGPDGNPVPREDIRGGNRRNHNRGRDLKPSQKVEVATSREPKKDSDIPLYGKIN